MASDPAGLPRVDSRVIEFPASWDAVFDVTLDGRRVLSIDPARYRARPDGSRGKRWPPSFVPFLTGRAEVGFQRHVDGEPLGVLDVAFDERTGRVALVDEAGHPLAADKYGRLTRSLDSLEDGLRDELVRDVRDLLADLTEVTDEPAFVAYGTLLGAVRDGQLIGHDTDADVSYLSRFTDPADVVRQSFAVQRGLLERGWEVYRSTMTFLAVWRPGADETRRIDVFTSYYVDGVFSIDFSVRGELDRSSLVPLGEVTLAGQRLPAPKDPAALLELTYGPGWRTPDPAFRFSPPRSTVVRTAGFFGHTVVRDMTTIPPELRPPGPDDPLAPTAFARWVHGRTDPAATLVDVRQGVTHDPFWWADQGRQVLALDVRTASRTHQVDRPELAERLRLERLPLQQLRSTMIIGTRVAAGPAPRVLAAYRVPDGLRPNARANLWVLARMVLAAGGELLIELADRGRLDEVRRGVAGAGGTVVDELEQPAGGVRVVASWGASSPDP